MSVFLNGVRIDSTTNSTNIVPNIQFEVGNTSALNRPYLGYVSNVRAIKGTHPYNAASSTITVPTTPLTAITNTSLLTCQSNRFVDNSSNNFAITRNGDVRVTPWSPFAPTSAYDPATNGGSGYFDGSTDYIYTTSSTQFAFGTGDWTMEAWFYPTTTTTNMRLWQFSDDKDNVDVNISTTGSLNYYNGTTSTTSSGGFVNVNQWNHIALVRSSGTVKGYVNGVEVLSQASTPNTTSSRILYIGGVTNVWFNGYISNFRVVKGTAVYTSAFTPPTAPVTNITNTSLLLNFTNAGIFDTAGDNVIETVGNAQISTAVKRYGSGSLYFDGTGDYLQFNQYNPDLFAFGTGDFTIEAWVYPLTTQTGFIYDGRTTGGGVQPVLYLNSNQLRYYTNSAERITGGTLSNNTWTHVAVCRSGTSTRMFINGVQTGSTFSDTLNYTNPTNRPVIGVAGDNLSASLNGYLDDLRVTKGFARYTATFTPPTAELAIVGTTDNIVNNSTYGVYQLA
jgi:hypothetical protein